MISLRSSRRRTEKRISESMSIEGFLAFSFQLWSNFLKHTHQHSTLLWIFSLFALHMIKQDAGLLSLLSLQDNRSSSQQVFLISGGKLTHAPFTASRKEEGCIILCLLAQRKKVERCFAGFYLSSEKMYFGEVTPTLWTLEPLVRSFFIFDSPFERSFPSCQFSLFFFQKLNKATLDQG